MMGSVLLALGMAGLTVGVVLSRSNKLIRTSARAVAGAEGGVQDAVRRLVRNSSWSPTCPPTTYSIVVSGARVDVCASRSGSSVTVQSTGTAEGVSRRIDAILSVDAVSGKITVSSSNEVPL
jgi:hypothetical protein